MAWAACKPKLGRWGHPTPYGEAECEFFDQTRSSTVGRPRDPEREAVRCKERIAAPAARPACAAFLTRPRRSGRTKIERLARERAVGERLLAFLRRGEHVIADLAEQHGDLEAWRLEVLDERRDERAVTTRAIQRRLP